MANDAQAAMRRGVLQRPGMSPRGWAGQAKEDLSAARCGPASKFPPLSFFFLSLSFFFVFVSFFLFSLSVLHPISFRSAFQGRAKWRECQRIYVPDGSNWLCRLRGMAISKAGRS